jgi:hypothetical protein
MAPRPQIWSLASWQVYKVQGDVLVRSRVAGTIYGGRQYGEKPPGKWPNENVIDSVSWRHEKLKKYQVRFVAFRDCSWRGRGRLDIVLWMISTFSGSSSFREPGFRDVTTEEFLSAHVYQFYESVYQIELVSSS